MQDIEEFDPQLYTTLRNIQKSDNVDVMDLTFSVTFDNFGMEEVRDLIENGRNIPVTQENKLHFTESYADWFLNKSIQEQFLPFYEGFYKVMSKETIKVTFFESSYSTAMRSSSS